MFYGCDFFLFFRQRNLSRPSTDLAEIWQLARWPEVGVSCECRSQLPNGG